MATEATHCYVAREKCGCITAATVDRPDAPKSVSEDVAEFIADGRTVERVTLEDCRENFGHKCGQELQARLLATSGENGG